MGSLIRKTVEVVVIGKTRSLAERATRIRRSVDLNVRTLVKHDAAVRRREPEVYRAVRAPPAWGCQNATGEDEVVVVAVAVATAAVVAISTTGTRG
jgi:hypothetical protein